MKAQPDLLAHALPTAQDVVALSTADALKIRGAGLSPAQERFNTLLMRIETLTQRREDTRAAADGHRPRHSATLGPLEKQQQALTRRMALWLHERLQRKVSLTVAQQRMASDILCRLCESLAAQGDAEMQSLHDAYSPHSLRAKQQDATQEMQALFEDLLGRPLEGVDANDPEAFMRAAMAQVQAQAQADKEARQARQQARKAAKPKSARQKQAEQTRMDAQGALRTVFRQLASALHPDREPDAAERQRKTALMSRANAAYERRDLAELLKLQLHLEQADPEAITRLADDKVNALALLLKEQVQALEQDLRVLEQQVFQEFDLPPYVAITPANLARHLAQMRDALENDLALMQRDLERVQDEREFKRWLKAQKPLAQDEPFAFAFDDRPSPRTRR